MGSKIAMRGPVVSALVGGCALRGVEKEMTDISTVCYLRCNKRTDRLA